MDVSAKYLGGSAAAHIVTIGTRAFAHNNTPTSYEIGAP